MTDTTRDHQPADMEAYPFSFTDLEVYITIRYGPDPSAQYVSSRTNVVKQTNSRIARLSGWNTATVCHWRHTGALSHDQADRVAAALDTHPICIWGTTWIDDINPDTVPDDDHWTHISSNGHRATERRRLQRAERRL